MRRDGPRLAERMRQKYGITWVLDRDVRQCMICDEPFTVRRGEAARRALVPCSDFALDSSRLQFGSTIAGSVDHQRGRNSDNNSPPGRRARLQACGRVVCDLCASRRVLLPGSKHVKRVCFECFDKVGALVKVASIVS